MEKRRLSPRFSRINALYQLGFDSAEEDVVPSSDEEAGNSSSDDDFDGLPTVTAEGGASAAATESSARWRQVTAANDQAPSITPFLGTPGLNPDIDIPQDADSNFFLKTFLTDVLIEKLKEWTNTRVLQDLVEDDDVINDLRDETIFSDSDIKKFLGIFLLM